MRVRRHPMLIPRGRFRGMGDAVNAPCPSVQQLMGVSDPTDPCQSGAVIPASAGITQDQLDNIKNFFYSAGQDNSTSALPSWLLPVALGIGALVLFKSFSR